MAQAPDYLRHRKPTNKAWLDRWVRGYTGVSISSESVCAGHSAPFDMFAEQVLDRPSLTLWHGPRGSGKSFLSGLDTHVTSRFNPGHKTKILGGSAAQSEQIYEALKQIVLDGGGPFGSEEDTIRRFLERKVYYHNKSMVSLLAASKTSVRGPHVQSLKLDEVDEIDEEIRESAIGMVMELRNQRASILMTSTWHKPSGPMTGLMERGRAGEFPSHTYCVFEVLERCPESRSGPHLELCPDCPIVSWCHADRDSHPLGLPKAKRSTGHYTIDSLIQKAKATSERTFKSDYLCQGPQVQGVWFGKFDEARNVSLSAGYDAGLPVHCSIDSGVYTGAVLFQTRHAERVVYVNIFAEHLSYDLGSELAAKQILDLIQSSCPNARLRVSTDSAGGAKNPVGITVTATYLNAGLRGERGIEHWPKYPGSVIDSLRFLEGFVCSATNEVRLTIHPSCVKTIQAFQSYCRAKVGGQWAEFPADPQHPHEDLIDAVRGGLKTEFPESHTPKANLQRKLASKVF